MFLIYLRQMIHGLLVSIGIMVLAVMLVACANLGNSGQVDAVGETISDAAISDIRKDKSSVSSETAVAEIALPKLELTKELLEQLILVSLASHNQQWSVAASNAFSAAQASNDPRLARLASLLAIRDENYTMAVAAATLWLQLNTEAANAEVTLLLAHLGAGDADPAFSILEKRQDGRPLDEYIKEVGGILVQQSNKEAALEIMTLYIESSPESAQVALSAAYVAQSFKDEKLTQAWAEKALELRPSWGLAAQMKANLLQRQNKNEEHSRYIKQFVEDNPQEYGMRINYAADLARKELFLPALEQMQIVLKNERGNVAALNYAAALAGQLEQIELAKRYYQKALALDPENDEVRWALARYAILDEKYLQAEQHYQQIASQDSYFRAQLQVANMRYHTQGLESAIDVLRALEPATELEYVDRATTRHYLLLQDHKYEEAYGAINETLAYLPNNVELKYARALVAAELSELKTMEEDLRSIIAKHPDHANALNALGYTLADQTDRYLEAKELILKALALRPNDAHILDSMGWVFFRLKDYPQAITFLQRAYESAPQVEVAAHLGEVLWESGDLEKARSIWAEAVAKDEDNPILVKTLERFGVRFADKKE